MTELEQRISYIKVVLYCASQDALATIEVEGGAEEEMEITKRLHDVLSGTLDQLYEERNRYKKMYEQLKILHEEDSRWDE